jgi:crotonobetainyl-CoA:carnitine CoA-transferase CaiB-like acyl-CoA transferase
MTGPLYGLRVIDLTQGLAGPYGTMLLADLGADVVKVEPPSGDETRALGPYRPDDELHAFGGFFQSANRGKRSIVLDLRCAEDVDTLLALVSQADALVESFAVGTMEGLGVSYERLRGINPRLVYASTRGFGDPRTGDSPFARWPTTELVAQAAGGPLGDGATLGDDGSGRAPARIPVPIGEVFPGALTALGIVSALLHARETGEGQYVDVAMRDGLLALCERLVYEHSYAAGSDGAAAVAEPPASPDDVLPATDGWVAIGVATPGAWAELCARIGRPELADDERFARRADRAARHEEIRALLTEWTSVRSRAEIVTALGGHVPVAPVNTIADIFAQVADGRDMLATVPHPGCAEPVTIAGQPIKFTATPAGVAGRAPLLDEHGDQIRGELAPDDGASSTDSDRRVTGLEAI